MNEPITREVSGVSCHGQRSIAVFGNTKNTIAAPNAPTANTRAASRAPSGTSGSPGSGTPESVRRLARHSAPTANGERM